MIQNGSYESFSNELGTLLIWLQLRQKTKVRQKLFLAYPDLYNRKQEGVS